MRNISILGSTGSIGTQAIEIVREHGHKISGLSAHSNIDLLTFQSEEFSPEIVAIMDTSLEKELKTRLFGKNIKVTSGMEGLCEVASKTSADIVLTAVVGAVGILPTIKAVEAGKDIALANKETLVAAGDIVMALARKKGIKILPVDSEHSAIFQCLMASGENTKPAKLIVCASGGPFFGKTRDELKSVTVSDALKHPSWSMGRKITIDSATLMNKGFEVIEAHHLFDMPFEKIEIVVQRESIIHSMVEYDDKTVIAQLSTPSMKSAIGFALSYPTRKRLEIPPIDFAKLGNLSFASPDYNIFSAPLICIEAAKAGGVAPAVLNAANEVAVEEFLAGRLDFLKIEDICREALSTHTKIQNPNIEQILEADKKTRESIKLKLK